MQKTFVYAFFAIILSMLECAGASHDKFMGLASPSPEIRNQTRKQLLLSDSEQLWIEVKQLILSKETREDVSEAALLLLRDKAGSLPGRLLPAAAHIPSARARATLLSIINLDAKNPDDLKTVGTMLENTNLIVRLLAASLLKDQKGYLEAVMVVGVQSLSSDETEWLGDPPRPAVIIGKQLFASLRDRKAVLAFLRNETSSVRRVQFHVRDLIAFLSKKSPRLVYNHIGDPTDQEAKLLSPP